jgi:hypothetical protein
VNINTAAGPWARLAWRLARGQPLTLTDAFLAGLASATGLTAAILDGAPRTAAAHLTGLVAALPAPLRELVTGTEVLVGEAVLAHRR